MLACGIAAGATLSALPAEAAPARHFVSGRVTITRHGRADRNERDVLLIPGLASGPSVWAGLVAALPGHRLHLVHIAGFAKLAAGANARGALLQPLAAELARYIRETGLRSPAIIGHSMGGTLAMMLGLRNDVTIGRILVVDMLPDGAGMVGGTSEGLGYLAGQLNGYFTGTKAGRQLLADMVARSPGGRDSDPRVIAQALSEMAQTDLTPRLSSLVCPLHVVYALPRDREMAATQAQRYRTAYARARQPRLAGIGPSGHMLMLDQPRRFLRAVENFLR
jgi:N-formylmaleamate deformylase